MGMLKSITALGILVKVAVIADTLKREVSVLRNVTFQVLVKNQLWWLQMQDKIKTLQEVCENLYDEYGLTEEILELQVVINKLRNKYNISDSKNRIYKNFVQ